MGPYNNYSVLYSDKTDAVTPLSAAASHGNEEILHYLLNDCKVKVPKSTNVKVVLLICILHD